MEQTASNIHTALAAADIPNICKNKTARLGSYQYRYASLDDIMAKIRKPLSEQGLTITHDLRDDHAKCYTILTHAGSGESIETSYPTLISDGDTHQKLGAKMTYARRYGLCLLLGIAPDEDADGAYQDDAKNNKSAEPSQADIAKLKNCKTVEELAETWLNDLTKEQRKSLIEIKDQVKKDLEEKQKESDANVNPGVSDMTIGNIEDAPTPEPTPQDREPIDEPMIPDGVNVSDKIADKNQKQCNKQDPEKKSKRRNLMPSNI